MIPPSPGIHTHTTRTHPHTPFSGGGGGQSVGCLIVIGWPNGYGKPQAGLYSYILAKRVWFKLIANAPPPPRRTTWLELLLTERDVAWMQQQAGEESTKAVCDASTPTGVGVA